MWVFIWMRCILSIYGLCKVVCLDVCECFVRFALGILIFMSNIHMHTVDFSGYLLLLFSFFLFALFLCNLFGHAVTLLNLCAYVFIFLLVFSGSLSFFFFQVKFNLWTKFLGVIFSSPLLSIGRVLLHFVFLVRTLMQLLVAFPFIINALQC